MLTRPSSKGIISATIVAPLADISIKLHTSIVNKKYRKSRYVSKKLFKTIIETLCVDILKKEKGNLVDCLNLVLVAMLLLSRDICASFTTLPPLPRSPSPYTGAWRCELFILPLWVRRYEQDKENEYCVRELTLYFEGVDTSKTRRARIV